LFILVLMERNYVDIVWLQYYTSSGLPSRKLEPDVCAVCGNKIIVLDNADAIVEKTYKLTCDHVYPSVML